MPCALLGRLLASTAALAVVAFAAPVDAQSPQGATVAAGSISVTRQGATTVVTQGTDKGVIDWRSFSIGPQEAVRFDQPGRSSVTLNRVTGAEISRIDGRISANGQVWLANPNGVMIGPSGQVNVGGLLATTGRIDADVFLRSGRAEIDQIGKDAAIVNGGTITVGEGGYAALAAAAIRNEGVVAARSGSVAFGAGKAVTVDFAGDKLIQFQVTERLEQAPSSAESLISNAGTIAAKGGVVLMSARAAKGVMDSVINVKGHVISNQVRIDGGTVVFGDGGTVQVSAKIDASDAVGAGGSITVLGEKVGLMDGAVIDASGATDGGTVLVGGDWQGGGAIGAQGRNAQVAYVAPTASINVDSTGAGPGGAVVVWADDTTRFNGAISARGGVYGGDGGRVETSGKKILAVGSSANVTAAKRSASGRAGAWLLDPNDITITNTSDVNVTGSPNFAGGGGTNATLTVATINNVLNTGTSVTVQTTAGGSGGSGDISFTNGTITTSFSGSALSLKLLADRNIVLASGTKIDLTGNTHGVVLAARANSGADGAVIIGGTVQTAGGAITVGGGPAGTLSAIGNATSSNIGIRVQTTGVVSSNGGAIALRGDGAAINGGSFGLYLQGRVLSGAGSITAVGNGGGAAAGVAAHGVLVDGGTLSATGAGAVALIGVRGLGNNSFNIQVTNTSLLSTVNGNLTLTGTSSLNGGASANLGVSLNSSIATVTGTGSITIDGVAGSTGGEGVAIGLGSTTLVSIGAGGTGTIAISGAPAGSNFGVAMTGGTVSTANGSAIFKTDTLSPNVITVGGTTTTFKTFTPGATIGVGGASGSLSLSSGLLSGLGSSGINIGDAAMTGAINVASGYVIPAAMSFQTSTGAINFAGALNADVGATRNLQIDTSGVVSFGGVVGGSTPLASLITNAGTSYLNGGVTTNFATNGSIFFSGRVILAANSTLTSQNSRIVLGQVDAFSNGSQALTVDAGTGTVSFTSAVGSVSALSSLSSIGAGPLTATGLVRATGSQSYNGQLLSASSVSLSSTNAILNGGANITNDLTIAGPATLRGTIQSGGTQSYGGAVILGANTTISTNNANVFFAGLNGAAIGGQSLTTSTGSGVLSLSSGAGGSTSLSTLSASGAGGLTVAGAVVTSGLQSYAGPVLLTASTTFTTGGPAITFGGALGTNAAGVGMSVSGVSNVSFLGVVGGGTTPLASLVLPSPATTTLNGTVTATTQSYGGGIILNNDATINAASGATFSGVNSAAGTARSLTVVTTVGGATANFGVFGIGGVTPLQTLSVTTNNAAVNIPGMTAANLTVSTTGGSIGQSGALNIAGTANFSAGAGSINLGTLSANNFSILFLNTTSNANVRDITAGMTLGASQINGTLTLTGASGGTVTQSGGLSTTNLVLLGTGVNYVLTNAANSLLNLAANTGSINISNAAANSFNSANIGGTNGITTTGTLGFSNGSNLSNLNSPVSAGDAVTLSANFFNGSGGINAPLLTITANSGVLTNVVVNSQTGAAAAAAVTLTPGSSISINGVSVSSASVATTPSTPSTPTTASTPSVATSPTVASTPSIPSVATVTPIAPTIANLPSLPSISTLASIPTIPNTASPILVLEVLANTLPSFGGEPTDVVLAKLLPQFTQATPLLSPSNTPVVSPMVNDRALISATPSGALIPPGPSFVEGTRAPLTVTQTVKVDAADTGGGIGQTIAPGGGQTPILPGLLSENTAPRGRTNTGEPPLAQLPSEIDVERTY